MSVLPVGFGGGGGAGAGYQIEKSLRFRASASARLERTFAVGNNILWTYSDWIKRGDLGRGQYIIGAASGASFFMVVFTAGDAINIFQFDSGTGTTINKITTAVFRDPSAHFHFHLIYDSANATAEDRVRLSINGVRITSFAGGGTNPSLNRGCYWNFNGLHTIGRNPTALTEYFDGYHSEINFIDNQAVAATEFGEFDSITGVWVPKAYTGTYGTNGFYLPFNDGTSLTTLTEDRSGNGNNWTATNISLTAGLTYDWMDDTPTNNFAVLNPLDKGVGATLTEGNLLGSTSASEVFGSNATIGISFGKFYWEIVSGSGLGVSMLGIRNAGAARTTYVGGDANGYGYYQNGQKYTNNVGTAYGASWTTNDVIGVAFDGDAGSITFYKNGVLQGVAYTGIPANTWFPAFSDGSGGLASADYANFGQRPFTYTPPTGFLPLSAANLAAPAIANPANHFDVVLDTGANIKTTAEGLYTDQLVWIKGRINTNNHQLIDSVRGTSAVLQSSSNSPETIYTDPTSTSVGWVWKANGTGAANTDGSIASTVSANTTSGFSIVTYTGTGANATVGHGLGVAPRMVIAKNRTTAGFNWGIYHSNLTSATFSLWLNTSDPQASNPTLWNSTSPTSSVFSVGTASNANQNTSNIVAYCFSEVEGFSKIGSYTGNGSADGPFVYCGFRPRWVMVKNISFGGNWYIHDTARDVGNVAQTRLFPDGNFVESVSTTNGAIDIVSNGFKVRTPGTDNNNVSGNVYIFMAFAESPFNYSRGR